MRSLAPELAKDNIRINCTLPGAVRTNLCNSDTWDSFPQDNFTTTQDIVNAVINALEDPTLTGKAIEISKKNIFYREQHEFCDAAQEATMGAAESSSF
jgi:short-subunit dehydrogenase